jgi:acetyl-CoA carboxylase biotin carboxyl carrier protein
MPRAKAAVLDKDLIRELAKLLDETGLGEIEIQQEGFKIRVARPTTHAVAGSVPASAPGARRRRPSKDPSPSGRPTSRRIQGS